jgi:BMFP domain-containing protein YqiC
MTKLTKKASELRAIAAELEAKDADAPRSATDVIRRYAPESANVRLAVPLMLVGRRDFDVRRHMVGNAGQQLAHHIAAKLDYELERATKSPFSSAPPFAHCSDDYYTATVYVFTSEELKRYTEAAFRAGEARL